MAHPDVSVIVAVHNRQESLPLLLNALEQQSYPAARYEVIVADNASTDTSIEVARSYAHGAPIRIRGTAVSSGGESAAKNQAAQEAEGRWLLFLDQDLLPDARFIESHIAAQERYAGYACIMGEIHPHSRLRNDVLTRWFLPENNRSSLQKKEPRFFEWAAHNLSIPKALYLESKGLDESYVASRFAETDLMIRLQKKSIPAIIEPDARCFVYCGVTFHTLRRLSYFEGRAIRQLAEHTDTPLLLRHYHLRRRLLRNLRDRAFIPFYLRTCEERPEDSRTLGKTYIRILRYERYLGYEDALHHRPPLWEMHPGHDAFPALRSSREY